jgi:hypothetical protein
MARIVACDSLMRQAQAEAADHILARERLVVRADKKRLEEVELAGVSACHGESSKVLDRRKRADDVGRGGYSESYIVPEGVCLRGWYRQQQAVDPDVDRAPSEVPAGKSKRIVWVIVPFGPGELANPKEPANERQKGA